MDNGTFSKQVHDFRRCNIMKRKQITQLFEPLVRRTVVSNDKYLRRRTKFRTSGEQVTCRRLAYNRKLRVDKACNVIPTALKIDGEYIAPSIFKVVDGATTLGDHNASCKSSALYNQIECNRRM